MKIKTIEKNNSRYKCNKIASPFTLWFILHVSHSPFQLVVLFYNFHHQLHTKVIEWIYMFLCSERFGIYRFLCSWSWFNWWHEKAPHLSDPTIYVVPCNYELLTWIHKINVIIKRDFTSNLYVKFQLCFTVYWDPSHETKCKCREVQNFIRFAFMYFKQL